MTDYHDPVTIAREFTLVVKLWHIVDGIFIWEFLTTLDYEWDIIRGRRPYRWTIWFYSLTRVFTLTAIVLNMIDFDAIAPINCQVWVTFEAFFAYSSLAAGTLLIVLRVIAIWNMRRIVVIIAMVVWVIDVSFLIHGIVWLRSTWLPEENTCAFLNLESTKANVICSLITDVILLLIMLVGLSRLHPVAGNAFGLRRVLWNQGLIWLSVATVAGVPLSVLMCLDLNVPMNLISQTPALIALSIAATRIHRSLNNSISDIPQGVPRENRQMASELQIRSGSVAPSRMEVSVRMERDEYPKTQKSCTSYTTTDLHGNYKAHEVRLDVDLESGPEK